MKNIKLLFAIMAICIMVTTTIYAQGPGFDEEVVDEVPFDGGVSIIAIAGAAYGAKKLRDARKKS